MSSLRSQAAGPDADLIEFAGLIAPQVDRLFVAGHRAARPLARPILQGLGAPTAGLLIDLRKLLLSPGGVETEDASVVDRYVDPDTIVDMLQEHVKQGLLQLDNGAFIPTEQGRDVLLQLTDALASGITQLWAAEKAAVQTATALASTVIVSATETLPRESYPAFMAESSGYMPPNPGPAFTLWSSLSTLRYLRADAHALAFQDAGLAAVEADILTTLWRANEPKDLATLAAGRREIDVHRLLPRLHGRRWIQESDGRWTITDRGRRLRENMERETDVRNAPPFEALELRERMQLVHILARLPSAGNT